MQYLRGSVRKSAALMSCSLCLLGSCGSKERADVFEPGNASEEDKFSVQVIPNPDVPHDRIPSALESFTEGPCKTLVPGFVTQCGVVLVPESPGSDATIELAITRVFTDSANPLPEPVVYLDGGPGVGSLGNVEWLFEAFSKAAPDRDFIFVDQRGIGETRPKLSCSEGGSVEKALTGCFERLSQKVDLNEYNSKNNATDFDLVREALGYEKWNLLGISYGTRLALTIMRDHPEGVRAVLIDAVVPLQVDVLGEVGKSGYRAFRETFAACTEDPDCASAYPDPESQLLTVVQALQDEPQALDLFIDGEVFANFLFQLMYSPFGVEIVPLLIDQAANEDFEFFERLATATGEAEATSQFSFAMHLSLQCKEEIPFSSAAEYDAFDAEVPQALRAVLTGNEYLEFCEYWAVDPADAIENEPVESDIPTLVIAGRFDPITPPAFAEAAAASLSNSQYVYIENESHGASGSPCASMMISQFFNAPGEDVSTACLSELSALDWEIQSWRTDLNLPRARQIHMRTTEPSDSEIERLSEDLRRRRL